MSIPLFAPGYYAMKKGKKMPSIELDGRSEASFVLVDGKIVRTAAPNNAMSHAPPTFRPLESD